MRTILYSHFVFVFMSISLYGQELIDATALCESLGEAESSNIDRILDSLVHLTLLGQYQLSFLSFACGVALFFVFIRGMHQ